MITLRKRKSDVLTRCTLCHRKEKAIEHALFFCHKAKTIWVTLFPGLCCSNYKHLVYLNVWLEFSDRLNEDELARKSIAA